MSFDIYASGVGNFRYSKKNILDGKAIKLAKLLSYIKAGYGGRVGIASEVLPSGRSVTRTGVVALGWMMGIRDLENGITNLAMKRMARRGRISITVTEECWLSSFTNVEHVNLYFRCNDSPREFVRGIYEILQKTDMANVGVLSKLGVVINDYFFHTSEYTVPILNIQLYC